MRCDRASLEQHSLTRRGRSKTEAQGSLELLRSPNHSQTNHTADMSRGGGVGGLSRSPTSRSWSRAIRKLTGASNVTRYSCNCKRGSRFTNSSSCESEPHGDDSIAKIRPLRESQSFEAAELIGRSEALLTVCLAQQLFTGEDSERVSVWQQLRLVDFDDVTWRASVLVCNVRLQQHVPDILFFNEHRQRPSGLEAQPDAPSVGIGCSNHNGTPIDEMANQIVNNQCRASALSRWPCRFRNAVGCWEFIKLEPRSVSS